MNFLMSSIPFIFASPENLIMDKRDSVKTCKEIFCTKFGGTEEEWSKAVRGYISDGRIQFFTGDGYEAVTVERLSECDVKAVAVAYRENFDSEACVFNGVIVGKEGEFWEPQQEITEQFNEWL